jgi:hypothetical protein
MPNHTFASFPIGSKKREYGWNLPSILSKRSLVGLSWQSSEFPLAYPTPALYNDMNLLQSTYTLNKIINQQIASIALLIIITFLRRK